MLQCILSQNGLDAATLLSYTTTEVEAYGEQLRSTLSQVEAVESELLARPSMEHSPAVDPETLENNME